MPIGQEAFTEIAHEAYREGYRDGYQAGLLEGERMYGGRALPRKSLGRALPARRRRPQKPKKKRTLTAWQKFVRTNSKKNEFRLRGGKVNLKKLGVAYRKKTGKRKGKK